MTTEQRRLHRHQINGLIDVIDLDAEQNIGKLANVHSEGLLLLCEHALEMNKEYRFQLATHGEIELPWMEIKAQCRWLSEADAGNYFQVGCSILEAPTEAIAVLQQLDL